MLLFKKMIVSYQKNTFQEIFIYYVFYLFIVFIYVLNLIFWPILELTIIIILRGLINSIWVTNLITGILMCKWRQIYSFSVMFNTRNKSVESWCLLTAAQSKALSYRDDEVTTATHMINLQHTQLTQEDASRELRKHDPTVRTETDQHKERARAMLRMEPSETQITHVERTKRKCAEPPTFTQPLKNVTVKEGHAMKWVHS